MVGRKLFGRKPHYLVRWKGSNKDTWQDESDLTNCRESIDEYNADRVKPSEEDIRVHRVAPSKLVRWHPVNDSGDPAPNDGNGAFAKGNVELIPVHALRHQHNVNWAESLAQADHLQQQHRQ